LRKIQPGVVFEQVGYVPEPFCAPGRVIKLRDAAGAWDDGWRVVTAGERRPAEVVEAHSRDHLHIRRAGGDGD
jgi:hypothetical protein